MPQGLMFEHSNTIACVPFAPIAELVFLLSTVFRIRAGKIRRLENGMTQYVEQLERQLDRQNDAG